VQELVAHARSDWNVSKKDLALAYSKIYPMISGGPWFRPSDVLVAFRRIRQRLAPVRHQKALDVSQNVADHAVPFSEYPPCELCGADSSRPVLVARDGNRVVECENCGLWFTSPRVPEQLWHEWLAAQESERNKRVTENRLRHGVALDRNVAYAFSFWWRLRQRRYRALVRKLVAEHGSNPHRLFDVGCGVGFLLQCAKDLGLESAGNDLNGYAVSRMRDALGLNVHPYLLSELKDRADFAGQWDIVVMRDYIEHTYHPLADLKAAHSLMAQGGLIYIHTFFVDSRMGQRCRADWDQHMWNHVFHFSSRSLPSMVTKAGFAVERVELEQGIGDMTVIARK
jgi:2-polyprenyl-3-methyl-5-hydroxy-6-metoxy-1,4-benzoquinol methylase